MQGPPSSGVQGHPASSPRLMPSPAAASACPAPTPWLRSSPLATVHREMNGWGWGLCRGTVPMGGAGGRGQAWACACKCAPEHGQARVAAGVCVWLHTEPRGCICASLIDGWSGDTRICVCVHVLAFMCLGVCIHVCEWLCVCFHALLNSGAYTCTRVYARVYLCSLHMCMCLSVSVYVSFILEL